MTDDRTPSSSSIGSLESAALKRKAKLEELRAKKARREGGEHDAGGVGGGKLELPKPIFRSYKPQDESLKEAILPEVASGEIAEHVREVLDKENEGVEIDQMDFTNLAPRKPDWDLKRDVGPKLEKLERRTQRAIAELIRERLQQEDLANAVSAGAAAARKAAAEEDDD